MLFRICPLKGVPWKLQKKGMMTRHDLKVWHLVQVVLLSFFHVNEASRHVMMLMHQQHIDEATAWLSKTITSKCWCMYHVLAHFLTRRVQRNSSCVSKFRGSPARTCPRAYRNFWHVLQPWWNRMLLRSCSHMSRKKQRHWSFCDARLWKNVYWAEKKVANVTEILNNWSITSCTLLFRTRCRRSKQRCSKIGEEHIAWKNVPGSNSSIVSLKCMKKTEMSWKLCKSRRCLNSCVWLSVQVPKSIYLAGIFADEVMKSSMKIWRRCCRNGKHSCVLHRFAR